MDDSGAIRRLATALGLLVALTVAGTAGYVLLADMTLLEALYQTVTTISTVGFEEVRPLDDDARIFTILLIMGGVGAALYTFAAMAEFLVAGHFVKFLGRRSMERNLAALHDHVIVCGAGRLGQAVVDELERSRIPLVVIEEDRDVAARFEDAHFPVLLASAADEGVLGRARISHARALAAVTGSEAVNVFVVLAAREESAGISIYARAETETGARRLRRAGATQVVSPHHLAGTRLAHAIVRPAVVDFLELASPGLDGGIDLEEVVIAPGAALESQRVGDLAANGVRVSVVVIRREGEPLKVNPDAATRLAAGDRVVVVGDRENVTKVAELAGAKS